MIRINCMAAVLLLLAGSAGLGQEWAKEMFNHTTHDFGTVARGAKVEHSFTLQNKYKEDMRIATTRSSCGCASVKISKRLLKTWDKAEIVVTMDTRSFLGRKDSTVMVVFAAPFKAEAQLHVHCYIRSDVVVQPGSVEFGSVLQGTGARGKVTVTYAGRADWKIESVESANPHIEAQAVETARNVGKVAYELEVTLKEDAPVGYIRDHLILVTNDRNRSAARVPVPVEAVVIPAIVVRPRPLSLGVVETGQSVTRRLVVQSKTPFKVVVVECTDPRLKCNLPEEARNVHLISVVYTAGETPGKVSGTIFVKTDAAPDKPIEVPFHVQVVSRDPATFRDEGGGRRDEG